MPNPATDPSRRHVLKLAGVVGAGLALSGVRPFTAHADVVRPAQADVVHGDRATTLWYPAPADEARIIEQGLPLGNGRLGALVGGNPADDFCYVTDATLWTGDANDELQDDGQFPYERVHFGTFALLAKVRVAVPAHTDVRNYRRQLDLSNGVVNASYDVGGVHYQREAYASYPDDVIVLRLTQRGGGSYTGAVTLAGTHGETTSGEPATGTASFTAALGNGLRYAATIAVSSDRGKVAVRGSRIEFTNCAEVVIVISGGTDYAPNAATGYRLPGANPLAVARKKARTAAAVAGATLLRTHVADYRRHYDKMTVDLGTSSAAQRSLDTWSRINARHANPAVPDPELEASYLQFGRYLTITGSRGSLPTGLQGLWLSDNEPGWMGDYHTDVNVQMNYWLPDRAGLSSSFDALANYVVAQLPSWTTTTQRLFNDPRNRFRNTSGRIGGWTVAISTNTNGGGGWWWHPAGNAWLCNSLWQHYEYVQDKAYLRKIYPALKGACEFWEARLITTTVDGREVLVDDHDWSPEHGPQDALGITYAQELVWDLFEQYRTATVLLSKDKSYADTIRALQAKLYLPKVSPTSGWLEEWMSPDNLGETTHRHLSPLIGFFPGDRVNTDTSSKELLDGVRKLLVARGMDSFGWACAWRALCWARLGEGEFAYQLVRTVLRPSTNNSNGTAANFFDMYSLDTSAIFQIDANFGAAAAIVEMLLYSRPGVIELLPALPQAWTGGGQITGVGARGGFEVDLAWKAGKVTRATVRSVGGRTTELRAAGWRRRITLRPGESVTIRW